MHVSVLGLGRRGSAVAARLLDTGYDITVWNRSPQRDQPLVERGANAAADIAGAISGADVVMTSLTADAAVREVYLGPNGIIASLSGHTPHLVDLSTIAPSTSREMAERSAPAHYLQAPILGGPDALRAGKARLLLSGDEPAITSLETLWQHLSIGYVYTGGNGTATAMKLLSNLNLIAGTIVLSETVVAAQRAGLSAEVICKVFGNSPAVAPGVSVRLDDIVGGDHNGWWSIKLAEKDSRLALEMAEREGLTLLLGKTSEEVLHRADTLGYGDKDLASVVEVTRSQKGNT